MAANAKFGTLLLTGWLAASAAHAQIGSGMSAPQVRSGLADSAAVANRVADARQSNGSTRRQTSLLTDVRADLRRDGAAATVRQLAAAHQWDAVLDGIGRGESGWIAIAPLLADGADAGYAEGLSIALAEALPRAPGAVLHVLDLRNSPVLGVSSVCSAPFIEPKPGFVAAYKSKAEAAVRSVSGAKLQAARDACLAVLKTV